MRPALAACALLTLLAGSAAARNALEPPDLERYRRWGPLRVRPGIEISNVGYDDNILASAVQPVDDITATVSPRIEGLLLLGQRGFIELAQRFDFTTYVENSDESFVNAAGSARVTIPRRRIGLFVDGLRNRIFERPVELDGVRPQRDENGYGFGMVLRPGWRSQIELGWSRRSTDYPEDPGFAERLDRGTTRASVTARYGFLGRSALTLESWRQRIEFDVPVSAALRDSEEWAVLPGIDFGLGGALSGSLRVGWQRIDAVNATRPDFADLAGRGELAYKPTGRTTLRFDAFREPGFAVTDDSVYYLHGQYGLLVVHFVHRSVGLEAGGNVGRLTFPGSTTGDRTDALGSYRVGVRLRLAADRSGKRLEYSLRVGRFRRNSSIDSFDRSRTTVGLGAVLGF